MAEKTTINLELLTKACTPGGASVLTSVTELAPAAGPHAGIAPARYLAARGNEPTYAYETRFIDGQAANVVVVDSKGSALNRVEAAISAAVATGDKTFALLPRVRVTYEGQPPMYDFDMPHRVFDGHVRAGTIDGKPATADPKYRAARDASQANAKPLLEVSPVSLVLGSWDSTRAANQGRYRSALVGEIIGVLADQSDRGMTPPVRGAARFDMRAPSVKLTPADMEALLAAQEDELSPSTVAKIRKEAATAAKKDTRVSASPLGLGAIPPNMTGLGFIACSRIIRSHVLSFAALRQLRFGLGSQGDVACRVLLAALALDGLARSDSELNLRANCDLVEVADPVVELDQRYGNKLVLEALNIAEADELLAAAIKDAVVAGVRWEGQILDVMGNPLVAGGIEVEDPEDPK